MPTKQRLIPWDDVRVLWHGGYSLRAIAERLAIPPRTLGCQIQEYKPDLSDLSQVPKKVWDRYPEIAPPTKLSGYDPVKGLDLPWDSIADYLGTGLSVAETATACGVDVPGLEEAYKRDQPADFDTVTVWAAVLRARRNFDLMKAAERRALDGDLRALIVLQKQKYARHPKDSVPPPNHMREI